MKRFSYNKFYISQFTQHKLDTIKNILNKTTLHLQINSLTNSNHKYMKIFYETTYKKINPTI